MENLFLGSLGCAEDGNSLDLLGITHVLTATADPSKVRVPPGRRRLALAVRDEEDENLALHFDEAVSFMNDALNLPKGLSAVGCKRKRGRVLVHCKMGKSRSAALVAAYLVWGADMSLRAAHKHLRFCRRQVWLLRSRLAKNCFEHMNQAPAIPCPAFFRNVIFLTQNA